MPKPTIVNATNRTNIPASHRNSCEQATSDVTVLAVPCHIATAPCRACRSTILAWCSTRVPDVRGAKSFSTLDLCLYTEGKAHTGRDFHKDCPNQVSQPKALAQSFTWPRYLGSKGFRQTGTGDVIDRRSWTRHCEGKAK